jgi:hypothetical protein
VPASLTSIPSFFYIRRVRVDKSKPQWKNLPALTRNVLICFAGPCQQITIGRQLAVGVDNIVFCTANNTATQSDDNDRNIEGNRMKRRKFDAHALPRTVLSGDKIVHAPSHLSKVRDDRCVKVVHERENEMVIVVRSSTSLTMAATSNSALDHMYVFLSATLCGSADRRLKRDERGHILSCTAIQRLQFNATRNCGRLRQLRHVCPSQIVTPCGSDYCCC